MPLPAHRSRGIGLRQVALVLATASLLFAGATDAARHLNLVRVDTSHCRTCHAELFRGRDHLHRPVEECGSCHDVRINEAGTLVELVARGPALCLECHPALAAAGDLPTSHAPVLDSCLACHVPHAADNPSLVAMEPPELCWRCHDRSAVTASHRGQVIATTDCLTCHSVHGSQAKALLIGLKPHAPIVEGHCDSCHQQPFGGRIRLRRRGDRLCTGCHGDLVEGMGAAGSVHPALRGSRARAGCLVCHDPHVSAEPPLLRDGGPQLCDPCHRSVVQAARADNGHSPAATACLGCHAPHSSSLPALLRAPAPALCAGCHDPGDPDLTAAHLGPSSTPLDCVRCHSPHGSGQAKLLAPVVHAPLLTGCDLCHQGAADRLVGGGGAPLCLSCHSAVGELMERAAIPHPAMDRRSCIDCHEPHASAQVQLVREPGGGVCTECHPDQAVGAGEHAHGAIDRFGCGACHQPHGGDTPTLLRGSGSELCLDCHDPRRVRVEPGASTVKVVERYEMPAAMARIMARLRLSADGERDHPVMGHRTFGRPTAAEIARGESVFEGELNCLTCHDPHKGRSRRLLRWDAASSFEACAHCHPK